MKREDSGLNDQGTVRMAVAGDLPEVLLIAREAAGLPHWSEAVYRGMVEPAGWGAVLRCLLVLDLRGCVVGFGAVSVLTGISPREAEVESLAVATGFERRGLGGRLLRGLLDWAAQSGAGCTRLEVRASNGVALRLYERHGFVREGTRPLYYEGPAEDAVLLVYRTPATSA